MILIKKDSNIKLTTNFKEKEFFSKDSSLNGAHKLDYNLILACQYIRDYYNGRVEITSTYRTPEYNKKVGGVAGSTHTKYIAVDFKFLDKKINQQYQDDILNKTGCFEGLRKLNISGYFIYKSFNHIDTRTEKTHNYFNSSDEHGKYCFADYRKNK